MGHGRWKKTEGGSGGKRGHSNMEHWETTGEIKAHTKISRRRQNYMEIAEELEEVGLTADQFRVVCAEGLGKQYE
jgi:hypothetical protein